MYATSTEAVAASPAAAPATGPVNSHDEWSLLEEVVVGRVDGACIPAWHPSLEATVPEKHRGWFREFGGRPFPPALVEAAAEELETLCDVLRAEGVTVVRPDPVDWTAPFGSPDFGASRGLYGAMPRDILLVVGDEIIEAPMAWPSRAFESRAYRRLIKGYFRGGARWTAAPSPQRAADLYAPHNRARGFDVQAGGSVVTEFEPVFDAADFSRCGRDIFCQLSHVTNRFGIEWLRRHLGPDYRIHELDVTDPHAMHIDATFVPLAPGRVLVNPERITRLPAMFDDWEVLVPPPPTVPDEHPFYFSSGWLSMNVLSIDERRVLVEAAEEPMIRFLKGHGFEPIPVGFRNFGSFGGAFHCATSDIRRQSRLESHF